MSVLDFQGTVQLLECEQQSITVDRMIHDNYAHSEVRMHVGKPPQSLLILSRDEALVLSNLLAVAACAKDV